MSSGLSSNNSTVVSAFHTSLLHQGLVAMAILAIVLLAWNLLRAAQLRAAAAGSVATALELGPEPTARRLLRIVFGLIWIFDGILQAQSSMPLGMIPQVVAPPADSSASWVRHLVNSGATIWTNHPVAAASAAVWIQVGIGLFLLVAPRGIWSRLAGVSSVCWGLVVWIFGESFGGIFAPGSSWLFGTPGGVIFYCAAGVLIALPERYYSSPRLGRIVLGIMGTFFVGMAVLQAWPNNGFWQGRTAPGSSAGALSSMVRSMATTPQPAASSSALSAFASFDRSHGFAVNLFVVVALALIGLVLLSGRPAIVRWGVWAAAVLCVADWLLVQDFGFFGGVGTDPNSMMPMLAIIVGGYLALTRPAAVKVEALQPTRVGIWQAVRRNAIERPAFMLRAVAALGAVAVVLLGAVPMALASVNPNADPIVYQAINGTPSAVNTKAPAFSLVDQHGKSVTLASLHGKTLAITFLDPVCTSDCPLIAQEFRLADQGLGATAKQVELIAVVANPLYRSVAATQAFDRAEGMNRLRNWLYLTGSVAQLRRIWRQYGVSVVVEPDGSMVAHSDLVYVVDGRGRTRFVLDADPGPGTEATKASFSTVLRSSIASALADR